MFYGDISSVDVTYAATVLIGNQAVTVCCSLSVKQNGVVPNQWMSAADSEVLNLGNVMTSICVLAVSSPSHYDISPPFRLRKCIYSCSLLRDDAQPGVFLPSPAVH